MHTQHLAERGAPVLRLLSLVFSLTLGVNAQHVLYNSARDKTAQDALTASKSIARGAVFEAMLRNADAQSYHELDTTLAFLREQMRAKLSSFKVWKARSCQTSSLTERDCDRPDSVTPDGTLIHNGKCLSLTCYLSLVEGRLSVSVASESSPDLDDKIKALQKSIKDLQKADKTNDPRIFSALAHLSDAKDLLTYAQQIKDRFPTNKGLKSALSQISGGLDELITLYETVKRIWDGYRAVEVDITSLAPSREQIELQLLQLEQQHVKKLTMIRATARLDMGDTLQTIGEARGRLEHAGVLNSMETIDQTLRQEVSTLQSSSQPDLDRLQALLDGLYLSASVLASEDAAVRIQKNRESDEERRFTIQRRAINSSTYDLTLQSVAQRLSVYYQSGIKPSDVAQLIFYLTNSVTVPVIAAK